MSQLENRQRHVHNKSMFSGRHGSEKPLFNGLPRGGGQQFSVASRNVIAYEVHLLSPDEVLFNARLLDEKPQSPDDIIPSVIPVTKSNVILYEHRHGSAIPLRHAVVSLDQCQDVEQLWLQGMDIATESCDDTE